MSAKEAKKKFRFIMYCIIASTIRLIPKKPSQAALITSDIPIENLGDQALLLGSVKGLQKYKNLIIIDSGPNSSEQALKLNGYSDFKALDQFQAAFLSHSSFKETVALLYSLKRASRVFVIGADVLDGSYNSEEAYLKLQIMYLCSLAGVKSTVLGSSFSDDTSVDAIRGLRLCDGKVDVFCRDYYSQQRIAKFCKSKLSADVAFLMEPFEDVLEYGQYVLDSKTKYVGLCLREDDIDSEAKLRDVISVIKKAVDQLGEFCSVLVVPHHQKDLSTALKVASLSELKGINFIAPDKLPLTREIKCLVSKCEFVFTGRMHVAIATLGMGKVPISISYNQKFDGLYRHFEIESFKLISDFEKGLSLMSAFDNYWRNKGRIEQLVIENKQKVICLAQLNFEYGIA